MDASPIAPGLVVTPNSRDDLGKFTSFTYDTAVSTGLSPEAASRVDDRLASFVSAIVDGMAAENQTGECFEGEDRCGSFDLAMRQESCRGYLCVLIEVSGVHVGAASSDQGNYAFAFDPVTGATPSLTGAFGDSIGTALKAAVRDWQRGRGYLSEDFPADAKDITGWIPASDGIHVWFTASSIAPENEGAPFVVVPYPDVTTSPSDSVWVALPDAPSDPVYVILKQAARQADGSYLLTVDPLTPDLTRGPGDDCEAQYFSKPQEGFYCLENVTKRDRLVTVLPGARATVGDSDVSLPDLLSYAKTGPAVVAIYLDSDGYAEAVSAYEPVDPS